jgi:putative membrane protein
MLTILLILALLVAVVAVIFALQNPTAITVSFLVWKFDQSLALILLLALALGVIIGLLTILPSVIRSKWQLSARKKKIDALEKSLQEARTKIDSQTQQISELEKPVIPADGSGSAPAADTPIPSTPSTPPAGE